MWRVRLYETKKNKSPVADFITSLPVKIEAKVYDKIDLLKESGMFLGFPHTSYIKGYKGLRELRIKFSSNQIRVLYFYYAKKTFILLHGFKKKTNKIPGKELEIAKKRMEDHMRRYLK